MILNKNYKFDPSSDKDFDGFTIAKDNYIVDGQGHTVDGSGQVRIFTFTGSNVTLKNINIINANGSKGSAANFASLAMVDNCTFINNTASGSGGAIYINNAVENSKINSTFINNTANNGGAIYFNNETINTSINGYYEGNAAERGGGAIYIKGKSTNNNFTAEFYNNVAKAASGGGIFFYSFAENNRFEGVFRYNNASYGAGIFFYFKSNNNKFNSDFRFNIAKSCGGAMFFYNTTDNNSFTGYFINNSALGQIDTENGNGGAITFKDTSTNCVFTSYFVNNTARLYGGGVNYRQTPSNITFNSNFINNAAEYGGGVNFFETFEKIVVSSPTSVIVDRSKSKHEDIRNFNKRFSSSLNNSEGHLINITHANSIKEKGLQIVDLIAWSIFQSLEHGDSKFIDLIKNKDIDEVFK
ncbi:hypothetical protein [Methanobrevibacter sp.]|uniref:hypothetical protein n=1 Tax=Methanobrevibacter sp. TaxID=66852 RepID=UPI0025CF9B0B|nr:hypothetical protein [Methanobrevibacter sp.]MBQ2665696.1 DUF3800 domain-containing protein [Methanobrevibacter sp.]